MLVWVPADVVDGLPTSWWLLDLACNHRFLRAIPYVPGVQPPTWPTLPVK